MENRGNLYWEISFTARYDGAADITEKEAIDVTVSAHDFKDAYNKAEKMYTALLHTLPDKVHCATVLLRDDGTVIPSAKYNIYQANYIHEEDITAFFSVGADKCWRLTWRSCYEKRWSFCR